MLSDRPYMRDSYQREKTSVLTWLVSALVAAYVLQLVSQTPWVRGGQRAQDFLELSIPALKSGWVWTLFTHSFLHSTEFIFHAIINCVLLYVLGRELLPMLGTRRFLSLYAIASIVGGLAWAGVHWRFGTGTHVGTTAAIDALVIVFACFFPNQQRSFLVFFVPVTLKPKHIAYFLVGFDLLMLIAYEIPGQQMPWNMAVSSSAHLGGMLTGFLYYRFFYDAQWFIGSPDRADVELPRWMRRAKKAQPAPPPPEEVVVMPASREDIRAEVDRILDKINSQGFAALTPAEKRVLDEAKALLSRR